MYDYNITSVSEKQELYFNRSNKHPLLRTKQSIIVHNHINDMHHFVCRMNNLFRLSYAKKDGITLCNAA